MMGLGMVMDGASAQNGAEGGTGRQLAVRHSADWTFQVQPYLWLTAVNLDTQVGPVSGEADASIGDVLENLDGALMVHGEAHKGRWGVFSDFFWARLSATQNRGPGGGGNVSVSLDEVFLELAGTYDLGNEKLAFEPLFGLRLTYIDTKINITAAPGGSASSNSDSTWVDPMLGARMRYFFTDRWSWGMRGDAAGFGVGSEITLNASTDVRYRFSELFSLTLGYRYMYMEYEDGPVEVDMAMHGPGLGFLFSF